jgi:hypothetical protein
MRVFCPNCGKPNEAQPGHRAICDSCMSTFDVPNLPPSDTSPGLPSNIETQRDPGSVADTVLSGTPPPGVVSAPVPPPQPTQQSPWATPPAQPATWGAPSMQPAGYGMAPPQKTNGLAIASLVLGILCCVPFGGVLAIILGVVALQQISAQPQTGGKGLAIAGIVLGSISMLSVALFVLASLAGSH